MKRYRYSSHREGMLSQAYITDMKLTSDGSLVVSTFNGLNVYDRESDTFLLSVGWKIPKNED